MKIAHECPVLRRDGSEAAGRPPAIGPIWLLTARPTPLGDRNPEKIVFDVSDEEPAGGRR